ncbi:MAG: hypothetical protein D6694_15720 [Gammaproteobacteria bacterium]|nr:MAG: hypothetical protein D6694_15720 [Gammaproteobacteria bacterium]
MNTVPANSVSDPSHEQLSLDRDQLKQAFAQFSRLSREILKSYSALEENVEHLTDKLEVVSRDHLRALQEKQILAARLQGLLRVLPCAVVVLDARGRVDHYNDRARVLLPKIHQGSLWPSVVSASFDLSAATAIEARTKDGRYLHVATCPLDQSQGQLVVLTDVTDMRRLQNQVARNRRLATLGKAVTSLSHQLKTPLSTAMIYAKHLLNESLPQATRSEMASKLNASLCRINDYINDLLMFARGGRENAQTINLSDALPRWAAQWREIAEIKNIKLEIKTLSHQALKVLANEQALFEALTNLVVNAFEAVAERDAPKVLITSSVSETGSELEIAIEDNGPGIPPDLEDEIFDPFVSNKVDGTGLGLAIVHSVVRSVGGAVAISKGELGGACFVVLLPLVRDLQDGVLTAEAITGD